MRNGKLPHPPLASSPPCTRCHPRGRSTGSAWSYRPRSRWRCRSTCPSGSCRFRSSWCGTDGGRRGSFRHQCPANIRDLLGCPSNLFEQRIICKNLMTPLVSACGRSCCPSCTWGWSCSRWRAVCRTLSLRTQIRRCSKIGQTWIFSFHTKCYLHSEF